MVPPFRVMTRNLFLGADLAGVHAALIEPGGLSRLPEVVAGIFNPSPPLGLVQRTRFSTRAVALADEVAAARPSLIGVQEAARWQIREADHMVATDDHLSMLEAELVQRGLRYRRAVVIDNGHVELPSATGASVTLTNRAAILAAEGVVVTNACTDTFASTLPIETPLGTFELTRGWGSVDVQIAGATLRFVTTHLEVASSRAARRVQAGQASELVTGPARTELPVVIAGDFNARPGSPTYRKLRDQGFADAWTSANPDGPPGNTCCHTVGLNDPASQPKKRIDLILTRGPVVARTAFVVGADPADFKRGTWPSDHAGVVADLVIEPEAAS